MFCGKDNVASVEAQLQGNRLVISNAQPGHSALQLKVCVFQWSTWTDPHLFNPITYVVIKSLQVQIE